MKKVLLSTFLGLFLYNSPAIAQTKIAVMPFEVLSKDSNIQQFGLGTSDTLTNALGIIPDFVMVDRGQMSVIMKEQALQQSGFTNSDDAIKLGKILNVDILIIGSIQNEDKIYRITARFTEVETGKIIKSVQVTGNSIFSLQDQLADSIVKEQKITLNPNQINHIENITNATKNDLAYDLYTKGRTAYLKFSESGFKEAINYFDKALETDQKYTLALASKSEAQALLSYEYKKNGIEFENLLKDSEVNALESIKQNINLAESHRALSIVYNLQRKRKEAQEEAQKAININPNDAEANVSLWINTKFDPEDPLIHKAISLNPYLVPAYNHLGNAYVIKRKYKEAIDTFKKAIEINPSYASSYVNIALVYQEQKLYTKALENFKKAIEINQNYAFAYYHLANFYLEQGNSDLATENLNNSLKMNPKFPQALAKLAAIYNKQGRFREAEFMLKDLLIIDSKSKEISKELVNSYQGIANKYYTEKNYKEAIITYNKALNLDPNNALVLGKIAMIYYLNNDFQNSITNYKKALVIDPKNSELYDNLGISYQAQGENDKAITEYKKACELGRTTTCDWLKENKL